MNINRIFIRLLLLFYLLSTYLGATHIHNDSLASHADCKVCIVAKNLNGSDTPNSTLLVAECNGCYESFFVCKNIISRVILKGFNANAPPQLS